MRQVFLLFLSCCLLATADVQGKDNELPECYNSSDAVSGPGISGTAQRHPSILSKLIVGSPLSERESKGVCRARTEKVDPRLHNMSYNASCDISFDPTPYLLPQNHPLRPTLEKIFSNPNVLQNEETLRTAGFGESKAQKLSLVRVLPHPLVKGYLFKLYLESETRYKHPYSNQDWLIRRCMGAERIRNLIKAHQIRYFSVPEKWLFEIPNSPLFQKRKRLFVLVVQDMNIFQKQESARAWKKKITQQHLDELYLLMNNGCGSTMLSINIPFTKDEKFSFIDTEYPERQFNLLRIGRFFSKDMQTYWKQLIY